ncbi:MAG: hypothetical protein FWB96_04105 [Defluviitaleaceae bacterium]|nr:hypothetical protein [Defluviitaleaceae bacterium]MCL2262098.1 hypothetical protein [Defluviitaleaceae bacterium]
MSTFHTVLNIFLILLSAGAILFIIIRYGQNTKKQDDINRRFLEEEEAANAVRKKEIDPSLYYTADLDALPSIPENDPHQVMRCAKRTMIHLPLGTTNLKLKKMYGLAQMDKIAHYEENFNEYLKALIKWAASLMEEEKNDTDALSILETVVGLGCEFRNAYKLAADIYAARGDKSGLNNLYGRTRDNHFTDPHIRKQILDYIDGKEMS